MKVEVAILGSPSLIVLTVSADVKQHCTNERLQEMKPALLMYHYISWTAVQAMGFCLRLSSSSFRCCVASSDVG